ncbi:MAG: hypothetical protein P4N60_24820 [Verrucomicrobiae bacterium]|nr:hypothetical protein [Verrucomicrobiae bacterium]
MPASFISELILQPLFEAVFQVAGYYVGRVVVPLISGGRWKCDRLLRAEFKWGGFYHRRGQPIYLTAEATAGVGLVFSGLMIGMILWWYFSG